jgi:DNA modification methylase
MTALFLQGNSRDVLKNFPADYFHCVMTSPPYFGLRSYRDGIEDWGDWVGQLGGEPTPELYIQHLIQIMREVRRVLRPDGVLWLNIGDSWAGSGKGQMGDGSQASKHGKKQHTNTGSIQGGLEKGYSGNGVKPLDMILIPEQLALAARADGWYVRSILIWAKGVSCSDEFNGNPMPESVNGWRWERHRVKVGDNGRGETAWQDCPGCPKCEKSGGYILHKGSWRPTDSYEQILMLAKTNSYFCDREAVLERGVYPTGEYRAGGDGHKSLDTGSRTTEGLHNKDWNGNGGRNLRSVLLVPTTGYRGAHFAVYSPRLIEPLIKAATSEKGCCPHCGAPWARVIDRGLTVSSENTALQRVTMLDKTEGDQLSYDSKYKGGDIAGLAAQYSHQNKVIENERSRSRIIAAQLFPGDERAQQEYINHVHDHGGLDKGRTVGWLPTCSCNAGDPIPCRILDPFSGAGTTALVAERLGLDSVGIDTSAEYITLAESRLAEDERKRLDDQAKQLRKEARRAVKGR